MEILNGAAERKRTRYWALYALKPDQSVLYRPGEFSLDSIRSSIGNAQKRYGRRFTTRLQKDGGIRIWRVDGTRWPGAEAEVRVFGDGPVPVGAPTLDDAHDALVKTQDCLFLLERSPKSQGRDGLAAAKAAVASAQAAFDSAMAKAKASGEIREA